MTQYLLDTNACIGLLTGRQEQLRHVVSRRPAEALCVCSVVWAELRYGAARSHRPQATREAQDALLQRLASYPFDDAAADRYGHIRADLTRQGTPIGGNDLMITAICLDRDLTLITHNVNEFARVPELKIEDWQA